jgi:hypothetical protein
MTFSKRHNLSFPPPITTRYDAPEGLRYAVIQNAHDCGLSYPKIRSIVCLLLLTSPDSNNWSDANINNEVISSINQCAWYKVYDIAEALLSSIKGTYGYEPAVKYAEQMNAFFIEAGIGWQFAPNEGIIFRGDETFQLATAEAAKNLKGSGRKNAATEIEEAIRDISRRPDPDITGAIAHSMNAMECLAQDILGKNNGTLGKMAKHLDLPSPLDDVVFKLYGYATQNGRHVSESSNPASEDAELYVHIACALCSFLIKKDTQKKKSER